MAHLFIKHGRTTERVTHFWSNGSDCLAGPYRVLLFTHCFLRGNNENITIRVAVITGITSHRLHCSGRVSRVESLDKSRDG